MPKTSYDEAVYQQFNFTPNLTYSPTNVFVRIDHTESTSGTLAKIEVWKQGTATWYNISINYSATFLLEEVNVSAYINTQNDFNNLKVRYLSTASGMGKIANVEYIAVRVE